MIEELKRQIQDMSGRQARVALLAIVDAIPRIVSPHYRQVLQQILESAVRLGMGYPRG